jgi:translation initiation factor 4E
VGCVLSVRQAEDILSVWVEEEGEGVRSGALRSVTHGIYVASPDEAYREKILTLLSLPLTTTCEYRSNKALLDAAAKPPSEIANHTQPTSNGGTDHTIPSTNTHHTNQNRTSYHHREGREGYPRRENGWASRRE